MYGFSYESVVRTENAKKLVDLLINMAPDKETKEKVESIIHNGTYKDFSLGVDLHMKDNPKIDLQRRVSMAYLAIINPETFDYFVNNDIKLFHGTNANALPTILKYGLLSKVSSEEKDIDVVTGEAVAIPSIPSRDFISFTDLLELAGGYSRIKARKGDQLLSFPLIIGTTRELLVENDLTTVFSDFTEIGVVHEFPLSDIKVIAVPSDKVEFVKKMVGNNNIKVLGIDTFINRIFRFNHVDVALKPDIETEIENIKKNLIEKQKDIVFSKEEIKEVAKKISFKKIIETMSNIFVERKEEFDSGRSI